VYKIK